VTTTLAAAWRSLLDELAAAAAVVEGPTGARNGRERAEGYRHLTRVLAIASEMLLEKGDPRHPAFTRWMTPFRKMYGDNPRTVYDAAILDADRTYRIVGRCGTCAYLGFVVYGTDDSGGKRFVAALDDDAMTFDADGGFELWLGPQRPADLPDGASFLTLEPDTTEVMVRQYFVDPERETEATYTIATVPDAGPPPPPTEHEIAERLRAVGAYVRETVEAETTLSALSASISTSVFRHGSEHVDASGTAVDPPMDTSVIVRVMPTPAIQYSGQWFDDLDDDEVLVVEGAVPTCRYWSVQLLTRFMESGDWLHHPVFLTGRDIEADDDGRFRVVIAHRDPGVPNWLATTGVPSANVAVRALKADGVLDVRFSRQRLPLDEEVTA
jgi:hypothetical protein